MRNFLVIDCESVGLYGDSFAVGYVVVTRDGIRTDEGIICTSATNAQGLNDNYEWVSKNVSIDLNLPPQISLQIVDTLYDLRHLFWLTWKRFIEIRKVQYLAADCLYPVESKFLIESVLQDERKRQYQAPYPFVDISTLLLACGKDPKAEYERLEDEKPSHNPLMDARQSARIMIECMNQLNILNIPK